MQIFHHTKLLLLHPNFVIIRLFLSFNIYIRFRTSIFTAYIQKYKNLRKISNRLWLAINTLETFTNAISNAFIVDHRFPNQTTADSHMVINDSQRPLFKSAMAHHIQTPILSKEGSLIFIPAFQKLHLAIRRR